MLFKANISKGFAFLHQGFTINDYGYRDVTNTLQPVKDLIMKKTKCNPACPYVSLPLYHFS